MESDKIEKLLEKYFEATATASEEATLRTYFSQDEVAEQHRQYAPMFRYFSEAGAERMTREIPLVPEAKSSKKPWLSFVAAAAIVLLLFGVYFDFETTSTAPDSFAALEDEYTQEEIASAQEALSLLAIKFNKGTEQLSHLEEFEKNTDRFLKVEPQEINNQ